jgi:hypothetical protein
MGDLIEFLKDNPGCIEAIKDWIVQQDVPEWAESLSGDLDFEFCPDCGATLEMLAADSGDEYYGCPECSCPD